MGFLSSFRGEDRSTSSHNSDYSDSTHLSQGASVIPRIKSESFPKKQTLYGTQTEAAEQPWQGLSRSNAAPLQAALRNDSLNLSFSSAKATVNRQPVIREELFGSLHPRLSDIDYTSIGQFQQQVELYRGSISTVYKAVCTATQTPVIIKAYEKSRMKPKNHARLEREVRLMQHLGGAESMVDLYAVFEDITHKYLIMEHCRGGDLFKQLMMKGGTLEEAWVCTEIIAPLLSILARMHKETIVHRDIKPENIFLTAALKFKLGDFGLAIRADEELPFTRSGTLDYMAPEVLGNHTTDLQESPKLSRAELKAHSIRPYDEKVDVWAAGILAYECVVGKPPFEVNDEVQTATLIMYSNKMYFPTRHSPEWKDFVRACLEKKPHMRPTAAAMLEHPWIRHACPPITCKAGPSYKIALMQRARLRLELVPTSGCSQSMLETCQIRGALWSSLSSFLPLLGTTSCCS
ncbi:hypothetical protein CVIRNUC_009399 [Coccomyxa viridis]|uniref:Protein kinase domain-containing protein n=1 Tax=Coccomyxa viridis TaxID=1274662 RepID=A0AAV1IHR2_9CHLO|nr:hypothetical protein CVIRNUC_009399 [Coccomyxa viridis]